MVGINTSSEESRAETRFPLSPSQERLWFLVQITPLPEAYNLRIAFMLRGNLNRGALRGSLDRLIARHQSLRTSFRLIDGVPAQIVQANQGAMFNLVEHDLCNVSGPEQDLERLMISEVREAFDLQAGPLIRGRLVRLAQDTHALLISMHHIVADGWSIGLLLDELSALYGASVADREDALPEVHLQYPDYAVRQRRLKHELSLDQDVKYWKSTLAGAPERLELPTDHARPAHQDNAGAVVELHLDEKLTADLLALGRRYGATLYMTVLAGWAALLGRLSGQYDIVIGTPVANRRGTDTEALIGLVVNTMVLRLDLSGSPRVCDLLARVKAQTLAAQRHHEIPFEKVVEIVAPTRSLALTPLFQVMFAWDNVPSGSLQLPGLEVRRLKVPSHVTARCDLTLSLRHSENVISGGVVYATSLFERGTIERYIACFKRLLAQMTQHEESQVKELPLLSSADRTELLEDWNRTATDLLESRLIHELFEARANREPDAIALSWQAKYISYMELWRRSAQLSVRLRLFGVRREDRVAVLADSGLDMIIAALGVLKAGGAYVPLDPECPHERLLYVVRDSGTDVVLAPAHLGPAFTWMREHARLLLLDHRNDAGDEESLQPDNSDPGGAESRSGQLAYVIYTSGSTGVPKGVFIEHKSVVNMIEWSERTQQISPCDVILQQTPFHFDASVSEIFRTLIAGARLVLYDASEHKDPLRIVDTIERAGVTIAGFAPSMLRVVLQTIRGCQCRSLRHVIAGGEELTTGDVDLFRRKLPEAILENQYGPTEATICATRHICASEDFGQPPIGRPIANTRIYVLDAGCEPVPIGVTGEIYIAGMGLARGYARNPELTAELFTAEPFGCEVGSRMYRTGDFGRWCHDGTLQFVGRKDLQLKLRGYRIESGEIEECLTEHPSVAEAVVLVVRESGEGHLVAYYTVKHTAECCPSRHEHVVDPDELRAHVAAKLPAYMVPAVYVLLNQMPLEANGKVDRTAFPKPGIEAYGARGYEEPDGDMETWLAGIWRELLCVDRVSRWDSFFELGGHSLLAVRLVSQVRKSFGIDMAVGDLFRYPRLASLTEFLKENHLREIEL